MKLKFPILITIPLMLLLSSCSSVSRPTAVGVVEYAAACADANKGKQIAVQGFLSVADKTPCMMFLGSTGIKRSCGFKLMDKINVVGKEIILYLPEGKENNQAETPDAGQPDVKQSKIFARNEIKLHMNDGAVITPQENIATPVIVTGQVDFTQSSGNEKICTITASKVEKREQ